MFFYSSTGIFFLYLDFWLLWCSLCNHALVWDGHTRKSQRSWGIPHNLIQDSFLLPGKMELSLFQQNIFWSVNLIKKDYFGKFLTKFKFSDIFHAKFFLLLNKKLWILIKNWTPVPFLPQLFAIPKMNQISWKSFYTNLIVIILRRMYLTANVFSRTIYEQTFSVSVN